jgi:hypothetical protein
MKLIFPLLLLALVLGFCVLQSCGTATEQGGGSTQEPLAGGTDDDDDDDDDNDPTGCISAVNEIYECSIWFNKDGFEQTLQDSLTECIALYEFNQAWICRLNCANNLDDCALLEDCLKLCPDVEPDEQDDEGGYGW